MNIYTALIVSLLTGIQSPAQARQRPVTDPCSIVPAPKTAHIARIAGDTVVVVNGSTYLFTPDTPEDQGRF